MGVSNLPSPYMKLPRLFEGFCETIADMHKKQTRHKCEFRIPIYEKVCIKVSSKMDKVSRNIKT